MRKDAIAGLSLALLLSGAAWADTVVQQTITTTGSGTSKKVVTRSTTTTDNGSPVTVERIETYGIDGLPMITERTLTLTPSGTTVITTPGVFVPVTPLTTESSTTTTTTQTTRSTSGRAPMTVVAGSVFYYPPYQIGLDQPVRLGYAASGAQSVRATITELTSGRSRTYTLAPVAGAGRYETTVPITDFVRGDSLKITYQPLDAQGIAYGSSQTVTYNTLQDPAIYQAQTFDDTPDLLIVPSQDKAANGPAFNVYWPELYFAQKPPYPLAARVTSSRAPQNSIRKLDPIAGRPGWFQFQVPALWYEPGETITVDFTTENQQAFNRDSDYPLDANMQFIPLDTVQFQTANQ